MNQYTTQGPPKPLRKIPGVTHTSVTPVPLPLWPLREWQRQACILYPHNPARQQQAILEHIQIAQHCTMNVDRLVWLSERGARLVEEMVVQPNHITRLAARITELTTALDALRRRGDGEAADVL